MKPNTPENSTTQSEADCSTAHCYADLIKIRDNYIKLEKDWRHSAAKKNLAGSLIGAAEAEGYAECFKIVIEDIDEIILA